MGGTGEIVQIRVEGRPVGIIYLKPALAAAAERELESGAEAADFLLTELERENYIPAPARAAYAESLLREYRRFRGEAVSEAPSSGLEIKVLGKGCASCERLERMVREVLVAEGLAGEIEHIRDLAAIAAWGPLPTPGLVVNGQVVSAGRVPDQQQLRLWLKAGAGSGSEGGGTAGGTDPRGGGR